MKAYILSAFDDPYEPKSHVLTPEAGIARGFSHILIVAPPVSRGIAEG
jgi:hypothetical protein